MGRKQKDLNQEVAELLEKVTSQQNGTPILPNELLEILQSNMLLSKILSAAVSKERQWYLRDEPEDVGNGFYQRQLQSKHGLLDVTVPRSRSGKFQSQLLPAKWIRQDNTMEEFLKELLLSGLSKAKIKQVLKTRSMTMPQELVDQISDEIEQEFRQILTKPIRGELIALIVDCKQVESILENGTIGMKYVYQAYGVDFEAYRDIYYFEVSEEPENAKKWMSIFSKLIDRGLRKFLILTTDNLSGISNAVDAIFKNTLHQLCVVHMKRNICKHLSKADAQEFKEQFEIIKLKTDFNDAKASFTRLCESFRDKHPHLMALMIKDADRYVAFVKLPKPVRKHLYSTNVVEGLNNMVECIRRSCGGYFRSEDHLVTSYAVNYKRLKSTKWLNKHPKIAGSLQELRLIFNSIFAGLD